MWRDSQLIPFGNFLSVPVHYKRNQAHIVYSVFFLCPNVYSAFFGVLCAQALLLPCSAHTALTLFSLGKELLLFLRREAADCKPLFSSVKTFVVKEYTRDNLNPAKVFSQITYSYYNWTSRSGLLSWWPRSRGAKAIGSAPKRYRGSQNTNRNKNLIWVEITWTEQRWRLKKIQRQLIKG